MVARLRRKKTLFEGLCLQDLSSAFVQVVRS